MELNVNLFDGCQKFTGRFTELSNNAVNIIHTTALSEKKRKCMNDALREVTINKKKKKSITLCVMCQYYLDL